MHELAICQSLMDQVNQIVYEHNAQAVELILLKIGPLSGVDPELLRQAFPLVAAGSKMEQAELVIEDQPVTVKCDTCAAVSEVPPNRLVCSNCGDYHTRLVSGDELLLASVELTQAVSNITEQEANHV